VIEGRAVNCKDYYRWITNAKKEHIEEVRKAIAQERSKHPKTVQSLFPLDR
jgi:hypothetical protein